MKLEGYLFLSKVSEAILIRRSFLYKRVAKEGGVNKSKKMLKKWVKGIAGEGIGGSCLLTKGTRTLIFD